MGTVLSDPDFDVSSPHAKTASEGLVGEDRSTRFFSERTSSQPATRWNGVTPPGSTATPLGRFSTPSTWEPTQNTVSPTLATVKTGMSSTRLALTIGLSVCALLFPLMGIGLFFCIRRLKRRTPQQLGRGLDGCPLLKCRFTIDDEDEEDTVYSENFNSAGTEVNAESVV